MKIWENFIKMKIIWKKKREKEGVKVVFGTEDRQ